MIPAPTEPGGSSSVTNIDQLYIHFPERRHHSFCQKVPTQHRQVGGLVAGALAVGDFVGDFVEAFVGAFVGDFVEAFVGDFVGAFVGDFVGAFEGDFVGDAVSEVPELPGSSEIGKHFSLKHARPLPQLVPSWTLIVPSPTL